MNNTISMNKRPLSPAELEKALAAKLRELPGKVDWLQDSEVQTVSGPDAGFDQANRRCISAKIGRVQEVASAAVSSSWG
ncbi:MAG TPA: hypothetical protein VF437_01795 [Verrucomicrobiae bacterium]